MANISVFFAGSTVLANEGGENRTGEWDGSSDFIRPGVMRLIKSRAPGKIRVKADRSLSLSFSFTLSLSDVSLTCSPFVFPFARYKSGINEKRKKPYSSRYQRKNHLETFSVRGTTNEHAQGAFNVLTQYIPAIRFAPFLPMTCPLGG